jgi:YD repeat-containing protein
VYPANSEVSQLRRRERVAAFARQSARGRTRPDRGWRSDHAELGYDGRYNQISGAGMDENGNAIDYSAGGDGLDIESIHYGSAGRRSSTTRQGADRRLDVAARNRLRRRLQREHRLQDVEAVGSFSTGLGYDGSIAAKLGNPTTISPPGRPPIIVSYDERGLRTSVAQGARASRFGYDENGNPVRIEHETGGGTLVETRAYEPNGFLKSITVAGLPVAGGGATVTEFEPDAAFRIHKITYPGGAQKTFRYGPQGHVEGYTLGNVDVEYQLDAHGNPIETRAGGDVIRTITWDGHDRMKQMVEKAEGGDAIYDYTYFRSGALASAKASDASGPVHSFEVTGIDALGRPTGVLYDGTTADAVVGYGYASGSVSTNGPVDAATHLYDTAGLISEFSDSGRTIGYGRDAAGASETVTVTEDTLTNVITLGHDAPEPAVGLGQRRRSLQLHPARGRRGHPGDRRGGRRHAADLHAARRTADAHAAAGPLRHRTRVRRLAQGVREARPERRRQHLHVHGGVPLPGPERDATRRRGDVGERPRRARQPDRDDDSGRQPDADLRPAGPPVVAGIRRGRSTLRAHDELGRDRPRARRDHDSAGPPVPSLYSYDALRSAARRRVQHPGRQLRSPTRSAATARTGITYPSGTAVTAARPDSRLTSLPAADRCSS